MDNQPKQATKKELQAITLAHLFAFSLDLSNDSNQPDLLICSLVLRCLPGKRLACLAQWRDQTVFAKIFIDSNRARIHFNSEKVGMQTLRQKGILAPKLIYSGYMPKEQIYIIVYEYIDSAQNALDIWQLAPEAEKRQMLCQLGLVLASHHRAGIVQKDLHLNNFLIANGLIYSLDGADIQSVNHAIGTNIGLNNLAWLFAQFYPKYDQWVDQVLDCYKSAIEWKIPRTYQNKFKNLIVKRRGQRKKQYLKKIFRQCSGFICEKRWNFFSVHDRRYDSALFREFLNNPESMINTAEALKIGNTSTVCKIQVDDHNLVIKRYNIRNWRHGIARALRPSRAARSWRSAHCLDFYGIRTPKPVALVEHRWGPIRKKAYFVSEYCDGLDGLNYFFSNDIDTEQKAAMAIKLKQLFRQLCSLKISHGDLKATNILIENNQPIIIDLDSMKEHRSGYIANKLWVRHVKRFLNNWDGNETLIELFNHHMKGFDR